LFVITKGIVLSIRSYQNIVDASSWDVAGSPRLPAARGRRGRERHRGLATPAGRGQLEQAITVTPIADGWTVKCAAREREAWFRSGAAAEAAAHRLGSEIAEVGDTAVIEIFLRNGALGGRYVHAPGAGI
jgi:hypothetical protein